MFSSNNSQVANDAVFVEDVFSNFLYTGNDSTQTITNGIDLSGKGGLVWGKARSSGTWYPYLSDTVRGLNYQLYSNDTSGENNVGSYLTATSTGYTINNGGSTWNNNATTYVNWTFRKQPKFFDVVTYTGNGTAGRTVAHNLGSVPGCIIVKQTNTARNWAVYHRGVGATGIMYLNSTAAVNTGVGPWNDTEPTSTQFTVGTSTFTNESGGTYVAYLFAHNAGGFGLTGTDNVISCGSYTGNGSATGPTVTLGYEPQWVMVKNATTGGVGNNWMMLDTMRGMPVGSADAILRANLSDAEVSADLLSPTATGFQLTTSDGSVNASGNTYIYIAIRRGPMKVPTDATKVFSPVIWTGNATTGRTLAHGLSQPPDMSITQWRDGAQSNLLWDKLRGFSTTSSVNSNYLRTPSTGAESGLSDYFYIPDMVNFGFGAVAGGASQLNGSGNTLVGWSYRRAPSFFDEVCYTGTGSATTQTHNLGVAPELIIVKRRNAARYWAVYAAPLGATKWLELETQDAVQTDTIWNDTAPTSSVFSVGTYNGVNGSGDTYVAYLFATCAGVSKCFNYTGNGSSQTINCGFTGGARWILIKRTDSTGDWFCWDSARGIVSGNDPHLSLNSTAAEVTTDDSIDTDSTGFVVNQLSATNINVSSATYIGIAIA